MAGRFGDQRPRTSVTRSRAGRDRPTDRARRQAAWKTTDPERAESRQKRQSKADRDNGTACRLQRLVDGATRPRPASAQRCDLHGAPCRPAVRARPRRRDLPRALESPSTRPPARGITVHSATNTRPRRVRGAGRSGAEHGRRRNADLVGWAPTAGDVHVRTGDLAGSPANGPPGERVKTGRRRVGVKIMARRGPRGRLEDEQQPDHGGKGENINTRRCEPPTATYRTCGTRRDHRRNPVRTNRMAPD